MATRPTESPTTVERAADASWARYMRIGLIAAAVLLLGGFAWAFFRARSDSEQSLAWDQLAQLRTDLELENDDLWIDAQGVEAASRERYRKALKAFLEVKAGEMDATLEPHARWLLARTTANQILNSTKVLDAATRAAWYDEAIKELETIRDKFAAFPLNQARFRLAAEGGAPTPTRQFLEFLERNKAWEAKHLPVNREPTGKHVLVLRTDRGDLRLRLFEEEAPEWTQRLIERATRGELDGMAFFTATGNARPRDPEQSWVRFGRSDVRAPKPFDRQAHLAYEEEPESRGIVPLDTRNTTVHVRGIVSAWHDTASEYDHEEDFVIVLGASPNMNYEWSPIGKAIDEASLATLDRIAQSRAWSDDADTRDDAEGRFAGILNVFQVPVVVQKALVFNEAGTLVEPAADATSPHRVAPTEKERSLAALEADAYNVPVPERPPIEPVVPPTDEAGDAPGDAAGSDEAGGNAGEDAPDSPPSDAPPDEMPPDDTPPEEAPPEEPSEADAGN